MSAKNYYQQISGVLGSIHTTQAAKLEQAGEAMAQAIAARKRVYLFGSGHSVIPVMDVFPRYGSFVGFVPLYDPRLMWWNVVGPGGARELLWLERSEGYIKQFLQSWPLDPGDCMVVFSHGGLNAAPVECALYAEQRGLTVITVSSHANAAIAAATHSSGKRLSDVGHIALDNCVAPEDSQVDVGRAEKVAAGSTMAAVFIAMALVAETGARLAARGFDLTTFVSPNVAGVEKDHNLRVFDTYTRMLYSRTPRDHDAA
ncbi:MAG: sugar isomerase domain-containing protein [Acidobacteria bacterium]|nr:sugar isomerase domain-containing protein [Acidobacteriota bacterium]